MPTRLIELVEALPKAKVLLVGDLMLDRYLYGHAERLSPDAPVPVLHYQREETRLGGAGRVAADLATLGVQTVVLATVGQDPHAEVMYKLLTNYGCQVHLYPLPDGRPTTCKTRLVGLAQHRHPQQMLRIDYEDASPISKEIAEQLLIKAEELLPHVDVLCIEDYNKGLLPPHFCQGLINLARKLNKPVIIDPAALPDYSKYKGATALKPNRFEAAKATGLSESTERAHEAANKLRQDLNLETAIVTLDRHGSLYSSAAETVHIHGKPRNVYDVTGAGDMLLAVVCAARAIGATWNEAVTLGTLASGLECEKEGSVPLTRPELIQELLAEGLQTQGKQRTLASLLPELQLHKKAGKSIVFTNGCFDLLHLGHVEYFRYAKSQGDLLVVAVNTDASIQRLKGDKRPLVPQADRLAVLEELASIDYLLPFDTDTPLDLIQAIQPNVLVKGADYTKEQVVGWDLVESTGGRIALAPLIQGRSTTTLINKILDTHTLPK